MKSPTTIPADLALAFKRTFARRLMSFWDVHSGFDICAFDDSIQFSLPGYKDGESLKQAIQRVHGDEGVQIIERLMAL